MKESSTGQLLVELLLTIMTTSYYLALLLPLPLPLLLLPLLLLLLLLLSLIHISEPTRPY